MGPAAHFLFLMGRAGGFGRMREQLLRLLEPIVEALGYELIEIEFVPQGRESVLRLFVDRAEGIDVEDCAAVSKAVSATLDESDPIPGHYSLEVSSPGLDRILSKRAHYARYLGSRVHVQLASPLDGRRRFTGTLSAVDADGVTVEVDRQTFILPFRLIQRTRLKPEY
jgi:ribosome maturation factor RimP